MDDSNEDLSRFLTVEISPQYTELSDWLRGEDLVFRKVNPTELSDGIQDRRKAFLAIVALFLQAHHGDYEDEGDEYLASLAARRDITEIL